MLINEKNVSELMKQCFNCGSDITTIQKQKTKISPVSHWYFHEGKTYCEKCNSKLFKNPRRLNPKGKHRIVLEQNPRTGICQICLRKVGEGIKRTSLHHIQYHNDPLKDTIELCNSCHMKETWVLNPTLNRRH